jgi:hypothetical protein
VPVRQGRLGAPAGRAYALMEVIAGAMVIGGIAVIMLAPRLMRR